MEGKSIPFFRYSPSRSNESIERKNGIQYKDVYSHKSEEELANAMEDSELNIYGGSQ